MQPMYTMHGFDMHDRRGAHGLHFVTAIRNDFTSQLPKLFPMLQQAISDEFTKELSESKVIDGKIEKAREGRYRTD